MNVLSLFDGMSTLQESLKQQGIKVDNYYASEIKPHAIKLSKYHFPNMVHLGDITKWREWDIDWSSIDIVGSGSPCQDISIAGKQKGIVNGERSSLFFTFIDILNHVRKLNPNVKFLQENVVGKDEDIRIISEALGVYPQKINSALYVAQNRNRYYWSNIRTIQTMFDTVTYVELHDQTDEQLKDIITSGFVDLNKSACLLESNERPNAPHQYKKLFRRHELGFQTVVFFNSDLDYKGGCRVFDREELCKLQGFSSNYCDILTRNEAASLLGDGWTLPVINQFTKYLK